MKKEEISEPADHPSVPEQAMEKDKKPKLGRIGIQIIHMVVLPVLLISLSAGILAAIRLNHVLIEEAKSQLSDMVQTASAGLSSEIDLIENAMGIAALAFMDRFDHQRYASEGDGYVTGFAEKYDGFTREGINNFTGAVGLYFMFAPGYGKEVPTIWYYDDPDTEIGPVRLYDQTNPLTVSSDHPDFQYYYAPILTGEPYWTDVYYDPDVEMWMISYSVPLWSDGQIIGILGVDFTSHKFAEYLERFDHGETGYAFVFTETETVLSHPTVPFGLTLDEFHNPETDVLVREMRTEKSHHVFSYYYAGSDKYMGLQRLDNGWKIGVTIEEDEILYAVRANRISTVIAIVSSMLLAGLVAFLLTRSILAPLNRMNKEISRALSDDSYQLNLSRVSGRENELGVVSRAFEELHYKNRDTLNQLIRENLEKERLSAMGDKLPDISHEVQGKLGTVVTAVTFVSETVETVASEFPDDLFESIHDGLSIAQSSATQAARIMQSVKNTSAAQLNLSKTEFYLRQLVDDIVVSLSYLSKNKSIVYDLQIPDILKLKGQAGYIAQILDNLIGNSLRHGFRNQSDGRITITIEYRDDSLLMDYIDNGTGISPEIVDRVFDRFFTTAREAGGTGIGLYLVRTLVEQEMRGSIEIRDRDVPGVHFHIVLKEIEIPGD